jgi:nucleoside-diphosphate-sugar epimerase
MGEVGRSVAAALHEHGHRVIEVSSRAPLADAPEAVGLDAAVELIRGGEVGAVVNAAGRGDRRPVDRTGLDAAGQLGPACADVGVPAVLLSTTRVLEGHDVDYREDAPPYPVTDYARANANSEQEWLRVGGPRACVLRITNYFCQPSSPESPQSLLLPWSLVTEAMRSGRIGVRSGPSTSREFVSATDVAQAVRVLFDTPPPSRVCATNPGLPVTLSDLTGAVQGAFAALGRAVPSTSFGVDTGSAPSCQPGWLADLGCAGQLTLADVQKSIEDWMLRWTGSGQFPNTVPEVPRS